MRGTLGCKQRECDGLQRRDWCSTWSCKVGAMIKETNHRDGRNKVVTSLLCVLQLESQFSARVFSTLHTTPIMSCSQGACCPDDTALADTVTQCAATDPTLAACCMREIHQQRYANKLRARLLEHDPTYVRRDIKLRTVAAPPATNSSADNESCWEDDDDVVGRCGCGPFS